MRTEKEDNEGTSGQMGAFDIPQSGFLPGFEYSVTSLRVTV